jgi:SM-20-related protein
VSEADVADAFARSGLAAQPRFLSAAEVDALRADCEALRRAGALRPARVGSAASATLRREVRGDLIAWIDAAGATTAQRRFLERMEALRSEINRRTYRGLFDFECHFAVYPPGSGYARHFDRFRDGGRRVVSCVAYLNEGWRAEDGGTLRVYARGSAAESATDAARAGFSDVQPAAGTLVVFGSAEVEHEVMPARRERMSIAGWFRTRA